MSFSFELKSHPEKKLVDHLYKVAYLSKDIVNSKFIKNRDLYSKIAYFNGVSHDFGKSTTAFQKYIRDPNEKSKYTYHSFISSLFGYYLLKEYLEKNELSDEFWYLPTITWVVINKHHGNINNLKYSEIPKFNENSKIDLVTEQIKDINNFHFNEIKHIYGDILSYSQIEEFFNILTFEYSKFTKEISKNIKKMFREKNIDYYFLILFFYSVLLDADKLDASGLERVPKRVEILEKDLVDQYKSVKFKNHDGINQIRERAYQEVNSQLSDINLENDRILSINLPTGVGKTLTSFSFALGLQDNVQKEKGFNPKIIYSLPFLSIIDQNSSVISEILAGRNKKGWEELFILEKEGKENYIRENVPSNLLLKHHHLVDIKYREEKDNELNIIEDINKSLLLTEGWHSEVVITTFIQFFHSLITHKNRSARKFHNMVNSIIILDEIQSIPHKYWLLSNRMLKYLASEFNCWVILITATKPLIFDKEEIKELVNNRDMYFEAFDRVDFNFNLNEKDFDVFKEEIFNEIIEEKDRDIMVVLNTVNSSKNLYNHLKERLSEKYGVIDEKLIDGDGICNFNDLELIIMTTYILPSYRLNRIDRIKNDKKRKIIITTQLVEAGVDISVDTIYRDLAPLDSIIQTAGRCNRNDENERGIVNTIVLNDGKREFYKYVYDSTLIDATKEIITQTGGNISEKDFVMKAADDYYSLVKERGSPQESREIIDHLIKLEFSDTSKFQLIENNLPTASIFIEINEEAEKIREYMEEIQKEFKRFERKNKLLEIRKHINSFTLSISYNKKLEDEIGHLPLVGRIEDYKYVPKKDLEEWYSLDSGFRSPENDIDMRIM